MSSPQEQMAQDRCDAAAEYSDWVDSNADDLLQDYIETLDADVLPKSVYEGYLDDDHEKAEEVYFNSLTIKDVPNDWLSDEYEKYLEDN